MEFKTATKKEFDEFLDNYPNKLVWNVAGMYEPPLGTLNDFTISDKWPESVVAKIIMEWLGPNGEIDKENHKKFWEYKIPIEQSKDYEEIK